MISGCQCQKPGIEKCKSIRTELMTKIAQWWILPEILPLLKLCERSELVNISQLFLSFSQTRLLAVEKKQNQS